MQHPVYEWLRTHALATDPELEALQRAEYTREFSLFREVNSLLYAGILVFCGGLGTFVYNHIDSIGHLVLIIAIFTVSAGCLAFSHRRYEPYARRKVLPPSLFLPYLVLLGISLFLLWEGYVEYQYQLFKGYYELPSLLAALLCFLVAYRFDHEGVLSVALATLAATVGLTILPHKWFVGQVEYNNALFVSGVCMGGFILAAGYGLAIKDIKSHFESTWALVGAFLLLMCAVGLQVRDSEWMALFIIPACAGLFLYARKLKSIGLYILLLVLGYVSVTVLLFWIMPDDFWIFGFYYFPAGIGLIGYMILKYKRFLEIPA